MSEGSRTSCKGCECFEAYEIGEEDQWCCYWTCILCRKRFEDGKGIIKQFPTRGGICSSCGISHREACEDAECFVCGVLECPHAEPLHLHHDGCPVCSFDVPACQ